MVLRICWFMCLLLMSNMAMAQFWFGARVGFHRNDYRYQDNETRFVELNGGDLFQNELYAPVRADYNFEFGGTATYTATDIYSVHVELNFERYKKSVSSLEGAFQIDNSFTYNYLSLPLLMRISFGRGPIHYYGNLGPKISYLTVATGTVFNQNFVENRLGPRDVRFVFDANDALNDASKVVLEEPNRIQYSLNFGGGVLVDLSTGGRLMIDLRYSWGHSNLGLNRDSQLFGLGENVEVSNQSISFSVGYAIPYNPAELLKGSSTNELLNSSRKKRKRKNR